VQASQALQRVLGIAREFSHELCIDKDDGTEEAENLNRDLEAITLCEQILTVAVPIARFRCYVTVEKVGLKSKLGLGDFAVSGIDISSIKNGLVGLSMEEVSVYIQLWEHREEGKFDMLCGYQGKTKNLGFRNWLKDIDRHQAEKQTNAIQMNGNGPSQS
jgi:hypothetical protein